jgi:hypothetical protein
MGEDGFAALAARSAQVRNEHRLLLEGLKAFEKRLCELVDGLGFRGCSKEIVLQEFTDSDSEPVGHTNGFLGFDGQALYVAARDEPRAPWDDGDYSVYQVEKVGVEWQRRLSDPEVLDSLVQDLVHELEKDLDMTAPLVASLTGFLAVEKAEIDSDLDSYFDANPVFIASWVKARKAVITDPELSIALSCSHVETVLKKCLKTLGAEGYEDESLSSLISKTIKILRAGNTLDDHTKQMLTGASTICHGIATIRNRKSVAHGKNEGYILPTGDLAQTLNHLAGVISVFVIKHTDLVMASKLA